MKVFKAERLRLTWVSHVHHNHGRVIGQIGRFGKNYRKYQYRRYDTTEFGPDSHHFGPWCPTVFKTKRAAEAALIELVDPPHGQSGYDVERTQVAPEPWGPGLEWLKLGTRVRIRSQTIIRTIEAYAQSKNGGFIGRIYFLAGLTKEVWHESSLEPVCLLDEMVAD